MIIKKSTKEVTGKPIVVGELVLTPTIMYACYSKNVINCSASKELVFIEANVTPTSLKIIQNDKEWVIPI